MCTSSQNSQVECPTPMMVFGGRGFGKWSGCEGRALPNGIPTPLWRGQRASSWREEKSVCNPKRGLSPESSHAGTASRTGRNKYLMFRPSGLQSFVTTAWADTDHMRLHPFHSNLSGHVLQMLQLQNLLISLPGLSDWVGHQLPRPPTHTISIIKNRNEDLSCGAMHHLGPVTCHHSKAYNTVPSSSHA